MLKQQECYLDKIEDEQQIEAIRKLNEKPSESFLYSLVQFFKKS